MTVSLLNIAFVAFVSVLLWQIVSKILYKSSPYPLPPGPPGEPVLGHLRVIPFEDPATTYQKWGEEYGSDVLYFKTLGQPFIVLNSVKSAVELLDKRGSNYCDRPRFVLLELLGWGMTLTFLRWGPKMKLHRQILQSPFTKPNVVQYKDLQLAEAHQAVKNIMQKPSTWELSLKRFAVAIVLNVAYGVKVTTDDDPYIKIAEDASYATGHSGAPAGTVVDRIPAVKFLPSWLPGLECLKFAEDWRWAIETIHEVPFKAALERMEEGKLDKSFIHTHLEKFNKNAEKGLPNDFDLADIKGAAGAIYIAGGDTTMTTLIIFVAVMMIYPDVQKKAQAEVDAIVGSERLPDFDDLPNLPYITNLIQELYRYNPLSPLGIPHRSIEDDVYNGMLIPAGTIIYQNVRAMTLDPEVYSDPETFNPDRYISKDEGGKGEPFPIGNFGFGRRVCVGRHLASNSIFIVVATILATMNIRYPSGSDGKEEKFEIQWSKIGTAHPLPFPSAMTPRSKVAEQLIFNSV